MENAAKFSEHNKRNPNITVRLRTPEDKAALQQRAEVAKKTVNKLIIDVLFGQEKGIASGNTSGTAVPEKGIASGNTPGEVARLRGYVAFFFGLFQKNKPFNDISPEDLQVLKEILAYIKS